METKSSTFWRFSVSGLMLALSAVGCAKAQEDVVEVDAAFQPYLASFLRDAADHGREVEVRSLRVQFGATKNAQERAFCVRSSEAAPTITVNAQSWENSTEAERENTIYHELGHCLLGQGHRASVDGSGIPVSLMNPYKLDPVIYESYRADLVSELFAN